jgi:adenylosuccinate lyase
LLQKQFRQYCVEGYPNPEALKGLTRTNEAIDKKAIHDFIATLQISDRLSRITQIT